MPYQDRGTRGWFLRVAAETAVGLAVAGCGGTQPKEVYSGRIAEWRGKEKISLRELNAYTEALRKLDDPFLTKISSDIDRLLVVRTRPEEIPAYVSPSTFPLQVCGDAGPFSRMHFTVGAVNPDHRFKVVGKGEGVEYEDFEAAIEVGDKGKGTNTGKGMLLAKEYISLMLMLRMQLDYWDYLQKTGYVITDANGGAITDVARRQRIGFSLYTMNRERQAPMILAEDMVPLMLLTSSILSSVKRGKLPNSNPEIDSFYYASKMVNSDLNLQVTWRITKDWTASNRLIPPSGILGSLLDPKVTGPASDLYRSIIGPVPTPAR